MEATSLTHTWSSPGHSSSNSLTGAFDMRDALADGEQLLGKLPSGYLPCSGEHFKIFTSIR